MKQTSHAPHDADGIARDAQGLTKCRVCKCTELRPCFPPCGWEPGEPDLCDSCADVIRKVREWLIGAHRPSVKALIIEARKPQGPGVARRKAVQS
jgi:hypothetical protein